MAKFRKKPVVIEATQWHVPGDDPDVVPFERDGKAWNGTCAQCNNLYIDHGWIDTMEGGHIVCPGDWLITGVKGERYPCKPDIFEETYERVGDK